MPFAISVISLQQPDISDAIAKIAAADIVISGFISPMQSLTDIGGMDDMTGISNIAAAYQRQKTQFETLLPQIKASNKPHVFISLRAPYDITDYGQFADVVLATYAYNTAEDPSLINAGNATYQALAQVLLGQIRPTGQLPVTVTERINNVCRDKAALPADTWRYACQPFTSVRCAAWVNYYRDDAWSITPAVGVMYMARCVMHNGMVGQ